MWAAELPRLILASQSPRRRELLAALDIPFEVVVSDVPEESQTREPALLARELAQRKALAVAQMYPQHLILAADTVVAASGRLLAKPRDSRENAAFLGLLSGQAHQVYTGVAVWKAGQLLSDVAQTTVHVRHLQPAEIAHYAATGEGLDKAGGYGIQGIGAALVSRIEGEYSNVVGLPLSVTVALLRQQGVSVWGV